jgi:acyl-CoA ligase (AMP-forming) (exosortase A-associated)
MDFLVPHMLRASADRRPEQEAVVQGGQRMTYGELARRAAGLAAGLRNAGLERSERVGIHVEPSVAQALSIFGVSMAGGVFVPVNSVLFPAQVAHIAQDCSMSALITTSSKLQSLVEGETKIPPSVRFLVVLGDGRTPSGGLPCYDFEELGGSSVPRTWAETGIEKDLAAILYTSGSTGKPKGVMLSHGQIMAGSSIVSTYLGITGNDRILGALPLSFDAGLNQLMTAIQHGGTFVFGAFVFAREIVQALVAERITGMGGVPTLWSLLVQPSSGLAKQTLPDLRYITNTGGRMPQSVLKLLRQALPSTRVFLMYGLTEAFRSTYLPPDELDRRPTSIGKAIPDTEILVIDEQGQLCKPGEVGELVHRGPTVSMGYWGQPELTARVLRPNPLLPAELGDVEKVCYSGDLVRMDEDGFLYFVGRRDNLIKSSGYRVSPTEVEEVLFQTGRLREAAIIGIPDDVLGQAIKAFVVPREGEVVEAAELLEFCAERLPRYMVPKVVEICPPLPKTASGKVDYPALRRREEAG